MLIWNESLTEQIELETCDWDNGYTDIKEKDGEKYIVYKTFTPAERKQLVIDEIKAWFFDVYRYQNEKFTRLVTLNKADDDGVSAAEKLNALYLEAEQKRARIQALEAEIAALEK